MTYPKRKILTASLLGFSLIILAALTLDQNLSLYFKRPELGAIWLMARAITNVGLGEHYFLAAVLLYIFARWVRPKYSRLREWSRDFFFALTISGIFLLVVKFCVGRQRPHISPDFNPFVFHPFTLNWDFQSFASGHAQVMFTVATMLSLAMPKAKWFFFIVAAFFGFTRVIIHDHFLSDVIGGATIGYIGTLTALYWVRLWQTRRA